MDYQIGSIIKLSMGRGNARIADKKEMDGITCYVVRTEETNELIVTVDDHIVKTIEEAPHDDNYSIDTQFGKVTMQFNHFDDRFYIYLDDHIIKSFADRGNAINYMMDLI